MTNAELRRSPLEATYRVMGEAAELDRMVSGLSTVAAEAQDAQISEIIESIDEINPLIGSEILAEGDLFPVVMDDFGSFTLGIPQPIKADDRNAPKGTYQGIGMIASPDGSHPLRIVHMIERDEEVYVDAAGSAIKKVNYSLVCANRAIITPLDYTKQHSIKDLQKVEGVIGHIDQKAFDPNGDQKLVIQAIGRTANGFFEKASQSEHEPLLPQIVSYINDLSILNGIAVVSKDYIVGGNTRFRDIGQNGKGLTFSTGERSVAATPIAFAYGAGYHRNSMGIFMSDVPELYIEAQSQEGEIVGLPAKSVERVIPLI